MPKPGYLSLSIDRKLSAKWQEVAEQLGYGERGRFKFLEVCLEMAEANRSLFRRR